MPLVQKHFGVIPRGVVPIEHKPFQPNFRLGKRYEQVEDTIPTDTIFCSYHFDGYMTPEVYAADVLCSVISDGISSRLYKALAYDELIASDVNAYVDDRRHTSLFTIYAVSNGEEYNCEALYTSMWKVLNSIVKDGITERELTKAKNRIRTRIARTIQRASGIADEAAHQALFFNEPERVFRLGDDYAAITAEEVHNLAQKLFRTDNEVRIDFVPKANTNETA